MPCGSRISGLMTTSTATRATALPAGSDAVIGVRTGGARVPIGGPAPLPGAVPLEMPPMSAAVLAQPIRVRTGAPGRRPPCRSGPDQRRGVRARRGSGRAMWRSGGCGASAGGADPADPAEPGRAGAVGARRAVTARPLVGRGGSPADRSAARRPPRTAGAASSAERRVDGRGGEPPAEQLDHRQGGQQRPDDRERPQQPPAGVQHARRRVGPKMAHSMAAGSAMPVVWNRNSGSANRVNTVGRPGEQPAPGQPAQHRRPDQLGDADLEDRQRDRCTPSAGAMLESSSGHPDHRPRDRAPENTRPIKPKSRRASSPRPAAGPRATGRPSRPGRRRTAAPCRAPEIRPWK